MCECPPVHAMGYGGYVAPYAQQQPQQVQPSSGTNIQYQQQQYWHHQQYQQQYWYPQQGLPSVPQQYHHQTHHHHHLNQQYYPQYHQVQQHHRHHHQLHQQESVAQSSNRQIRNLAEKNRRDKINQYISELGMLVPMVSCLPKKDKTSILRLSATFLRMHHTVVAGKDLMKKFPHLPHTMNWCQLILEGMEGLLLIVTGGGKIVFISPSVDNLLGHQQLDLLGQSLFNLAHPEDRRMLERELRAGRGERMTPMPGPTRHAGRLSERRSFYLRLQQRPSKGENPAYELVHVVGHLRLPPQNAASSSRDLMSGNDTVLVAMVKPFKEKRVSELSLLEANREEWISRHLIDGRIIYSDHRISYSSGYLSEEVTGIHAFTYMHKDDVRWVIIALRQMYESGQSYGCSCYRLKMKTGKFMYLRTQGYLEMGDSNSVQSFLCINTPVTKEEGDKLIEEMKKMFTPLLLNESEPVINAIAEDNISMPGSSKSESETLTEDPEKLEQCIGLLISEVPAGEIRTNQSETDEKIAIVSKVLPPVSVQSSLVGVSPPQLKKSSVSRPSPSSVDTPPVTPLAASPSAPPTPPTQCRPSVLRLAAPADTKRRADEAPAAKRPKSVIVSEPPPPPSPPRQFSPSGHVSPLVEENAEGRSSPELSFDKEWFTLGTSIDASGDLQLSFNDLPDTFDNSVLSGFEEREALVESLWTEELGRLEEGVVEGQSRLEGSIVRQGRQIAAIESDLAAVPPHVSAQANARIYESYTTLKAEHQKQWEILRSIKQEHQSITQQLPSTSHQLSHHDIGV